MHVRSQNMNLLNFIYLTKRQTTFYINLYIHVNSWDIPLHCCGKTTDCKVLTYTGSNHTNMSIL